MTALPPLMVGARRGVMLRLVGCAVLHAALAVGTALLVGRLVLATAEEVVWLALATAGTLAGMGGTKYAERVLAERLGQDYVHELRGRVTSAALSGGDNPSLGITIARTTNDLSSIRSWVAQGIAPLTAAVPLVLGAVAALGWLHWGLAVATLLPLLALTAVLGVVAREAYRRARALRRRRGRLASRLSDTLHAREGILVAGGVEREQRRIDRDSRRVVEAAVARSRTAGVLQAAALTTAAAMAVLVVMAGRVAGVDAGAVASALTIAGVLAAPLGETGRIVEFRQNYRAARRILAPLLASAAPAQGPAPEPRQVLSGRGTVQVRGLGAGQSSLTFSARTGDRIRLVGPDGARLSEALRQIAAPGPSEEVSVVVDGWDHGKLPPRRRRELVGLAARGTPLERGTIARALRYRHPDLEAEQAVAALAAVGLDRAVAELPKHEHTELRRGGAPLTPTQVARLKVVRAALGDPQVLLLDHIDSDLDAAGRTLLTQIVEDHPGVVVFASDNPEHVAASYRTVPIA